MNRLLSRLLSAAMPATISGITAIPVIANPLKFTVDDPKSRDQVSFTSDAPLELIQGHTSKIKGFITLDDSLDLTKKPLEARFDVDLASIDTGIALRNEHMRNNFLETKKYPEATFVLKSVSVKQNPVVLKSGQKEQLWCVGEFSCHGKTVTRTIPVDVTYYKKCPSTAAKMPGCDLLQIRAQFPVAFKDHEIKRPEVVFQKLADTVDVQVAVTAWVKAPSTSVK